MSVTAPVFLTGFGVDGAGGAARTGFNGGPVALDGEIISTFDDFDDLVGALLSSCHIPLYCGWPARNYRQGADGFCEN